MALPRNGVLALDMLPHLARCAKARETITYTELGALIGHPAFFLSGPLDYLRDQILLRHDLPRLDALVVNAETKEAGASFYADGREQISEAEYSDCWSRTCRDCSSGFKAV